MLGFLARGVSVVGSVGGAIWAASETANCAEKTPAVHLGRWIDSWKAGRTRWQQSDVNPTLLKHIDKILPAPAVFVPLCGKTLDLGWLAGRPEVELVVGTEAVEVAMKDLQESPGPIVGFQKIPEGDAVRPPRFASWAGAVLRPDGAVGRVVILEGDHFDLDRPDMPAYTAGGESPQVPAVWDRASLVAIRPQDREKYAQVYDRVVSPGGKILLTTFDYDPKAAMGPPHTVPESEVRRLFPKSSGWDVTTLETSPYDFGDNPKFRGVDVKECIFLITKTK